MHPIEKKVFCSILWTGFILALCSTACKQDQRQLPPTPMAAPLEVGPGDYDLALQHDGYLRTYSVHVPPGHSPDTHTPLVIYLHGGGGNARSAQLDGMHAAADRLGFILAAPEGTGEVRFGQLRAVWNGGQWEGGTCCGNADDVGFIAKMIDELIEKFKIDAGRIYAVGISNGGLMTNHLACELADRLAAVATVAPAAMPMDCSPSVPISIMDVHGTADPCNLFHGGESGISFCKNVDYTRMTPHQIVGSWLEINRCSDLATTVYAEGAAVCQSYSDCSWGVEVEFCSVEGMGHTWPSGAQYLPAAIVGPVSYDLSFDQIWAFLEKHSR